MSKNWIFTVEELQKINEKRIQKYSYQQPSFSGEF